MVIWITGRKNSGKTTLARKLAKQLDGVVLDGDEIRFLTHNREYDKKGIEKNLSDITHIALDYNSRGKNVIIACVSPIAAMRKKYQDMLPGCIEIEMPFGEMWPGTTWEATVYE